MARGQKSLNLAPGPCLSCPLRGTRPAPAGALALESALESAWVSALARRFGLQMRRCRFRRRGRRWELVDHQTFVENPYHVGPLLSYLRSEWRSSLYRLPGCRKEAHGLSWTTIVAQLIRVKLRVERRGACTCLICSCVEACSAVVIADQIESSR